MLAVGYESLTSHCRAPGDAAVHDPMTGLPGTHHAVVHDLASLQQGAVGGHLRHQALLPPARRSPGCTVRQLPAARAGGLALQGRPPGGCRHPVSRPGGRAGPAGSPARRSGGCRVPASSPGGRAGGHCRAAAAAGRAPLLQGEGLVQVQVLQDQRGPALQGGQQPQAAGGQPRHEAGGQQPQAAGVSRGTQLPRWRMD